MEVFQFDKSMMERLEEAQNVLVGNKSIPASRVIEEWSYSVELLIEPTGWQAIWKISRVICEELKIKYPTTVYGTVTNVLFKELKAIFTIIAIQDDDIHLPEEHEVPLIDLWPTKIQENPSINIETTANCVDMIRFFFKNIWMPWDADNDEDIDWATKYLELRIRFCYDLKAGMNQTLASHIRALLAEARDIQQRKEYLELDLSDDEDMNESKSQISDLMHLHIRQATIRNEIEMFENPKLRKVFEEIKFSQNKIGDVSVVMRKNCSLSQQIQDLEKARQIVDDEKEVKMSLSLQESLMTCASLGRIYLTTGLHHIKFLENLNSSIIGITTCDNSVDRTLKINIDESMQSVIMAKDFDNILLTLAGRLEIKNVLLDCRNVRTGILVREGSIRFENCTFVGDKSSSTSTSIIMLDNTTVTMDNCVIEDFATAISMRCKSTASLSLTNSSIYNSSTGIECNDKSCVTFKKSKIVDATHYGIITTSDKINEQTTKIVANNISEMKQHNISLTGDCEFQNCIPKNVVIFNKGNMCLLKGSSHPVHNTSVIETNCNSSKMESFDETINITNTSSCSEIDTSVIVIDD